MTAPPAQSDVVPVAGSVGLAAWFVLSFLFVWLKVDPAVLYHYRLPFFTLGASWLAEGGLKPGGLLDYAARFLTQFYQVSWLGAILITAVLALTYLATRRLLGCVATRPARLISMVPVNVLLFLASRYDYPWLNTSLGLVMALGMAVANQAVPATGSWLKLVIYCLLTAVLAQVAGIVPAALFILLGSLQGMIGTQRRLLAVAVLAAGGLILFLFLKLAGIKPGELARLQVKGVSHVMMSALYLFYPVVLLLAALFQGRNMVTSANIVNGKASAKSRPSRGDRMRQLGEAGLVSLAVQWSLFLATVGLACGTFNDNLKGLTQIDYFAGQEKWDRVLDAASRVKRFNGSSRLSINRALYHRGLLLDYLFSYAQTRDFGMLPGLSAGWEISRSLSATLLELGQINLAEHWAYEALEADGERPDILRLLFKIHIVKGQSQAARVILQALRKNLFHRKWAETVLDRLDADPLLADDPEIKHLRSVKVTTDFPASDHAATSMMQQLLHTNPNNRMAYEYLLANLLLNVQPEKLDSYLPRLGDFKYSAVPRHLEEALLANQQAVFLQTHQKPAIQLPGLQVRPETIRRFEGFLAVVNRFKGDFQAAHLSLAREYGDTFWHYSLYSQVYRSKPPSLEDLKP